MIDPAPSVFSSGKFYIRQEPVPPRAPPLLVSGPIAWLHRNFFSSIGNTILTLLGAALLYWIVPPVVEFLFTNATWNGTERAACLATPQRPEVGACWPFVKDRFAYFIYGSYPIAERWRVDAFFSLLCAGIFWLLWLDAPARLLGAIYFFVVLPILSFMLLSGAPAVGLPKVDTALWGGLLVTVVVATVGIVVSLPIGIVLALGRRSTMPLVKLFCVIFIEFVRGVPLITVLFMASVMLPLFVPETYSPDKLLRALVGVAVFSSAYMAEVVRAGLQAIPRGQYEAATALALGYWRGTGLVILPQALRVTIPIIVNNYIALFKDTTLVFIVGIFDFLRAIEVARIDPKWATPVTSTTGYAFAAIFYFVICYAMSRYAASVETRLAAGARRGEH